MQILTVKTARDGWSKSTKIVLNLFFKQPLSFYRLRGLVQCSFNDSGPITRNLIVRPNFSSLSNTQEARKVKRLSLEFKPPKPLLISHIFAGIGESFSNLEMLIIEEQNIKAVERENFKNLPKLTELKLYQNEIEFLPENVFQDLQNLKELVIALNRIKKLPENIFNNLRKIKIIHVNGNKINHLPKNLFSHNLELEEFAADRNQLTKIDVDFTQLPNLQTLTLKGANCINFEANSDRKEIEEAQQIINQDCRGKRKKNRIAWLLVFGQIHSIVENKNNW